MRDVGITGWTQSEKTDEPIDLSEDVDTDTGPRSDPNPASDGSDPIALPTETATDTDAIDLSEADDTEAGSDDTYGSTHDADAEPGPIELSAETETDADADADADTDAAGRDGDTGGAAADGSVGAVVPGNEIAAALVRRAIAGDDHAFATIVEHYDPMVRELTFHLLGNRPGMDDVLQTTYVKAYRALPRLPAGTTAGPWLYRIAYLSCLDELRRRHRHPQRSGPATHEPGDGPCSVTQHPLREAQRSGFSRAFANLAADHRAVVVLADPAGLGTPAIAGVIGVPVAAVTDLLTRARAVLRAALEAEGSEASEPDLGDP